MLFFVNDYCECCHPAILKRIESLGLEKNPGYGADDYCKEAKKKIQRETGCPDAEVFFLVGGTQTNQAVIDALLRPYEGVVAATSGHVSVHEAGAIEYTGHKVLNIPEHAGKMNPRELDAFVSDFYGDDNHEHMVFPGMVYISHPTEYGTVYTREELTEIRKVCDKHGMRLFLDGARLGYGLVCGETDLTLKDIAALTDAFYIGGTKVGAMFGEAVVFPKKDRPAHFVNHIKRHGALLAKGWLLALQFDTLFTDGLYYEISRNAIFCADLLKKALKKKGYTLFMENPTNQVFVVMENGRKDELAKTVAFDFTEKYDDTHTVIRFCTSWATKEEDVRKLIDLL